MDLNKAKEVALNTAREAGELLKRNLGKSNYIDFKGEIDLVTEMDKKAEELIINRLQSAFPDHSILTEEGGGFSTPSPYRWLIDPLDGTTNYAHGYPVFSVSIALERDGESTLGIVYDPCLDELFMAERGKGASLNERPIHVSKTESLNSSLLATGFPYDIRHSKENNLNHFCNLALKAQAIRRAGSAALDLCYVACGRFDGYWKLKLNPWDVAAGVLMVKEAGGKVTNLKEREFNILSGDIVASNGRIHREIIEVLNNT